MTRRIALIRLGMAVTPHAKSLIDALIEAGGKVKVANSE